MTILQTSSTSFGSQAAMSSDFYHIRYITDDNGRIIAEVNQHVGMEQDEALANARVLAGSASMLELLKELIDLRGQVNYDSIIWAEAMALVKKIEG